MKHLLIITTFLIFNHTMAQAQTKPEAEEDLQKSKWADVYSIIDDVKVQNPPRRYYIQMRWGIVQLTSNSLGDPLKLGLSGSLPAISLGVGSNFLGNFGAEARILYAANLISDSDSVNKSDSSIYWLDLGPRYTFYLDSTRLDNNITLKLLAHVNNANFKLQSSDASLFVINHYFGFSGSVERSIPITRKLGVVASLDLLQILDASGPAPIMHVSKSGYGFEVHGEIYYMLDLFRHQTRLGFSYWQQGNSNDYDDSSKEISSKSSYFQLSRAMFLNATTLF